MNVVGYYQVFGMKSHGSLHGLVPILMPMKLNKKYQKLIFYIGLTVIDIVITTL